MVTLIFKLSEIGTIRLETSGADSLAAVLGRLSAERGAEIGDIMAIKNGRVLADWEVLKDGDVIEIFPALSGG